MGVGFYILTDDEIVFSRCRTLFSNSSSSLSDFLCQPLRANSVLFVGKLGFCVLKRTILI